MPIFHLLAALVQVCLLIMDNIKIAVAMDEKGPLGVVPDLFAKTGQLLLVESALGTVREVFARAGRSDVELARKILEWNCECLLCGDIEREPFIIIADEGCVTRYNAAGLGFDNALKAFRADALELVRDHIGGQGCQSTDDGTPRECHEHN